ncbi:uncharacterized protein LTR77_003672 [Saxophila tyrrhenica]|uniref:F-box domain-containing protein n=1 Tax=Saxophila tyrrhenica TaxID=1690608 RepID=A0AAV9PEB8_9PEZI|nr:hypothetical protein LTR77_003672 [Saxophila tyrrhenica]
MAAAEVLNLPDLLEPILQHPPACNLSQLKRVNLTWKRIIETSADLRRATFMEADGKVIAMKTGISELWDHERRTWGPEYLVQEGKIVMAPIFEGRSRYPRYCRPRPLDLDVFTQHVMIFGNTLDVDLFVPASLHGMFITQPPINIIEVCIQRDIPQASLTRALLRDDNGMTLGHVVDTFRRMGPSLSVVQKPFATEKMLLMSRFCFVGEQHEDLPGTDGDYAFDDDSSETDSDDYPIFEFYNFDLVELARRKEKMMRKHLGERYHRSAGLMGATMSTPEGIMGVSGW